MFAAAAAIYASAYAVVALPSQPWQLLLAAFLLAGGGIGLAETAESSLVAQLLPDHLRGSGFGLLGGVQSLGDFASSVAVGILWTAISPTAGFAYAACWMLGTTAMPAPRSARTSAG